jgi:hypothetical protein
MVVSSMNIADSALPKFEVNFTVLESFAGNSRSIEIQVYVASRISIVSIDFGNLDLSTNLGL